MVMTTTLLPAGLRVLEREGLFIPAGPDEPQAGEARVLGRVLIGGDWLRVWRHPRGVVYHEQTDWMDADPDWMEDPAVAEIAALLACRCGHEADAHHEVTSGRACRADCLCIAYRPDNERQAA